MPSNDRPLSTKGIADALRDLMRAYVGTLENARDRIIFLGGDCDSLDKMVSGDPALRAAREALEQPSEPAADVVAAMLDYNQMLRSFAMIASRNGEQTRWEGLYDQIHALLAKHHETWKRYFPPMQGDEQPETKNPVQP